MQERCTKDAQKMHRRCTKEQQNKRTKEQQNPSETITVALLRLLHWLHLLSNVRGPQHFQHVFFFGLLVGVFAFVVPSWVPPSIRHLIERRGTGARSSMVHRGMHWGMERGGGWNRGRGGRSRGGGGSGGGDGGPVWCCAPLVLCLEGSVVASCLWCVVDLCLLFL